MPERVEAEKHLEKSWKIKQRDKRVELGKLPERVEDAKGDGGLGWVWSDWITIVFYSLFFIP